MTAPASPASQGADLTPAPQRFSIVVTCHNQRGFIQAAVDSAIAQNPLLLREVIVVDDSSTDGSLELLEPYGAAIQLLTLPRNSGAVEARNRGAARAGGEYLVFLDGDDVLTPWALDVYERLVLARSPTVISGEVRTFSGPVPCVMEQDLPVNITFAAYPTFFEKDRPAGLQASTYVVRRKDFWVVGGWTPRLFQLDLQDLSVKLGLFPVVLVCSPFTAFYRIHTSNTIHSVAPFIHNLHCILRKERAGEYPGGSKIRFSRYAWLGGLIIFWIRRSMRARLYREVFGLILAGHPMILAAIVRRAAACAYGRRPLEAIDLHLEQQRRAEIAGARSDT